MPPATTESTSSASTTGGQGTGNNLPWHLIPVFRPGETDVNEYTKRLEFLAQVWPQDQLQHLAPRACLLCEGTAFQKVVRLSPEKLKVGSLEGIKLVVSTLGGVWGRSKLELKYEKFEKALYGTTQKVDEANESYVARHEIQFEDLISMGATLEDMRAYILLRNSTLPPEDRKRIIVESKGALKYDQVISSLQLLGSRFFNEVQGSSNHGKENLWRTDGWRRRRKRISNGVDRIGISHSWTAWRPTSGLVCTRRRPWRSSHLPVRGHGDWNVAGRQRDRCGPQRLCGCPQPPFDQGQVERLLGKLKYLQRQGQVEKGIQRQQFSSSTIPRPKNSWKHM